MTKIEEETTNVFLNFRMKTDCHKSTLYKRETVMILVSILI